MGIYPAWLSYIAWIVGLAGLAFAVATMPEPEGRRRGFLKLAAFELIGTGILLGGIVGVLFNAHAEHFAAKGFLSAVRHHGGRNSSTQFVLVTDGGASIHLSTNFDEREFADGEFVELIYQAYTGTVLDLRVLRGEYEGFHYTNGGTMLSSCCMVAMGIFVVFIGLYRWKIDPNGTTQETDGLNRPPLNGIDPDSLLHLSKPD